MNTREDYVQNLKRVYNTANITHAEIIAKTKWTIYNEYNGKLHEGQKDTTFRKSTYIFVKEDQCKKDEHRDENFTVRIKEGSEL